MRSKFTALFVALFLLFSPAVFASSKKNASSAMPTVTSSHAKHHRSKKSKKTKRTMKPRKTKKPA